MTYLTLRPKYQKMMFRIIEDLGYEWSQVDWSKVKENLGVKNAIVDSQQLKQEAYFIIKDLLILKNGPKGQWDELEKMIDDLFKVYNPYNERPSQHESMPVKERYYYLLGNHVKELHELLDAGILKIYEKSAAADEDKKSLECDELLTNLQERIVLLNNAIEKVKGDVEDYTKKNSNQNFIIDQDEEGFQMPKPKKPSSNVSIYNNYYNNKGSDGIQRNRQKPDKPSDKEKSTDKNTPNPASHGLEDTPCEETNSFKFNQ